MDFEPLYSFLGDDLAGCSPEMEDFNNYMTVKEGLLLRLRLFYSEGVTNRIYQQIMTESNRVITPAYEYVVNELQYEVRRVATLPNLAVNPERDSRENQAVRQWAAYLLTRFPQDDVLDFVTGLKLSRDLRVRE